MAGSLRSCFDVRARGAAGAAIASASKVGRGIRGRARLGRKGQGGRRAAMGGGGGRVCVIQGGDGAVVYVLILLLILGIPSPPQSPFHQNKAYLIGGQ